MSKHQQISQFTKALSLTLLLLISQGEQAAQQMLPAIKKLLAKKGIKLRHSIQEKHND